MIDAAPDHSRKPFHSNRVPVSCPVCDKRFTLNASEHRKYVKAQTRACCCRSHGQAYARQRKAGVRV